MYFSQLNALLLPHTTYTIYIINNTQMIYANSKPHYYRWVLWLYEHLCEAAIVSHSFCMAPTDLKASLIPFTGYSPSTILMLFNSLPHTTVFYWASSFLVRYSYILAKFIPLLGCLHSLTICCILLLSIILTNLLTVALQLWLVWYLLSSIF